MPGIAQNEEKRFFYCDFSTKNRKVKERKKYIYLKIKISCKLKWLSH